MENKREELIELYDLYYSLLTDKQQQYFENYYFMDLTAEEYDLMIQMATNHGKVYD